MQKTLVLLANFVLFLATLTLSVTNVNAYELTNNKLGVYQVNENLQSLLVPVNQTERWNLVYKQTESDLPGFTSVIYNPKFDAFVTPQVPTPAVIAGQSAQVGEIKGAQTTPSNQLELAIVIDKSETKSVETKPAATTKSVTSVAKALPASNLDSLFDQYAQEYGLSASVLKRIAVCESGLRPEALSSNGLYGGLFQFVAGTWSSNRKAMGENPDPALRFNAQEAIKTAAFKISRDGYGAWPVCGTKAIASI